MVHPSRFQNMIGSPNYFQGVSTKYKDFCTSLGPCGKSKSLQGLLVSTKKIGVAMHFSEIISLEPHQKC